MIENSAKDVEEQQVADINSNTTKVIAQATDGTANGISKKMDQHVKNRSFDLSIDGTEVIDMSKIDVSIDQESKAMILPITRIETLSSKASHVESNQTVTKRRKEELLIAARKERIRWIMEASLPYEQSFLSLFPSEENENDKRVSLIAASHITANMPSIFSALGALYGSSEDNNVMSANVIGDKIESLLGQSLLNDKELALPNGNQILSAEIEAASLSKIDESDITNKYLILKSYQTFLSKLKEPACINIVQEMRMFCRTTNTIQNLQDLVSTLKTYFPTTMLTLRSHTVWTTPQFGTVTNMELSPSEEKEVNRSLESFIYAHCNQHIRTLLMTAVNEEEENDNKDTLLTEKIKSLSFVEPRHLEIKCLEDDTLDLNTILEIPVKELLSVDLYYSVFEKLQRILALYRGVNSALSVALNQNKHTTTSDNNKQQQHRKLPSADDILPTIIFVVIRSQPRNLLLNLKMIEELSPPEYLRGEAGYAYTNLYGAVQFILELNLEDEPKRLSITEQEYRDALSRCKDQTEQKFNNLKNILEESTNTLLLKPPQVPVLNRIPPMAIRLARQRGEIIDTDWAIRWYEQNDSTKVHMLESSDIAAIPDVEETIDDTPQTLPPVEYSLPTGFQRNYSFLATRPEDIRLADLPILLDEYRMLVQTVETLLSDKAAEVNRARKAKTIDKEKRIFAAAQEIDPTLLPSTTTSPSK